MNKKLNELQAFKAMINFLEKFYERTKSGDVGSLLGDLQLLDDKETADPAAWSDWMESVEEVLQKNIKD